MKKELTNKKGFTLVELLASVAILALIVSPLIHSFLTSASTSRRSHLVGNATLASRNILETIRARGTDWLRDGSDETDFVFLNYGARGTDTEGLAGGSTFDIRVTLDPGITQFADINEQKIPYNSPIDVIFVQPAPGYDKIIVNVSADNKKAKFEILGSEFNVDVNLPIEELLLDEFRVSFNPCDGGEKLPINVYLCLPLDTTDEIEINNFFGVELNIFVVNQNKMIPNTDSVNIILYEPVHDKINTSFFSNAPYKLTRHTPFSNVTTTVLDYPGLVDTDEHDRMFWVTVEVFERGSDMDDRPLLTSPAAQLD